MLAKHLLFCIILAIILLIKSLECVICPPQTLIACVCNTTRREISCRGPDIPIDEVFTKLTEYIPESHRDFDTFYLNSRSVRRLNANQFKGIRFRSVFLGGSKLTHIHRDAFFGTHLHIKELYAFATNLSLSEDPKYNLFDSITLLRNLQKLVISGSNIREIPDRAFKPRNKESVQRNLTEIELGLGVSATIQSIGSQAFASLPALRTLSLSSHRINHIKTKAFSFDEPSNKTLTIDLTDNYLNDNSFQLQAFEGANRPLKIYLGRTDCNKNLTFLNQTIFEPFLRENAHNIIDLGRVCTQIICDREMNWIWLGNYEHQVKNLKCKKEENLTDRGLKERSNKKRIGSSLKPSFKSNSLGNRRNQSNDSMRALNVDENENNWVDEYEYEYYEPKEKLCLTDECYEISIEMKKYLNHSLNPCDNFYDYACGRWEDSHLLEYLVQLLSNGGVEYDNFVKLRQQIDTNLDVVLSDTDNELHVINQTINMYQKCKQNNLSNIDRLMDRLNGMGGWPLLNNTSNIEEPTHDWKNAFVYILSFIRRDVLIDFDYIINENSVKQLKLSHHHFNITLANMLLEKEARLIEG